MKKLLSLIISACMMLSMTAVVGAEDAVPEEYPIYIGDVGYETLTEALGDAVEGDTIELVADTYTVDEGYLTVATKGVTLEGVDGDDGEAPIIIFNTLNGLYAGLNVDASDVTVRNIDFYVPDDCVIVKEFEKDGKLVSPWCTSIIGHYYENVKPRTGFVIEDCTVVSERDNVKVGIMMNAADFTVENCIFDGFPIGVYSETDASCEFASVNDNVFNNVDSALNLAWCGDGAESTVTFTGNEGDARATIHDYSATQAIGTIVSDNNDVEVILVDIAPADVEIDADDYVLSYSSSEKASELAPANETVYLNYGTYAETTVVVDESGDVTVLDLSGDAGEAFLNGSYYATIDEAIAAAETGDTIILATDAQMNDSLFMGSRFAGTPEDLVIDLNGNELTFADKAIVYLSNGDLTIMNGSINIDDYFVELAIYQPLNDNAGHALFAVYNGSNLTFEDVDISGRSFNTFSGFAYVYGKEEGSVNFINSTVDLVGDNSPMPAFIRAEEVTFGDYTVDIIDSDINLVGTGSGFTFADISIVDSTVTMKGNGENFDTAFNRCSAVVDNSNIRISGMEDCGIKLYNDDFEVINESTVDIKDCGEASVRLGSGSDPDADPVLFIEKGSKVSIETVEDMDLIKADKGVYWDTTPSGKLVFEMNTPEWFMMVLDLKRAAQNKTYTVTADATEGGSVSPEGEIKADKGDDVTLTFTADEGYTIGALLVDGEAVEAVDSVTFEAIDADHTVSVIFEKKAEEVKEWANPYTDVSEADDIYAAVKYVSETGLFEGTTENAFDPYATMTRAMFATVLWRASGAPTVDYLMSFEDVVMAEWYGEAVRWAASAKVVLGYSDTVFGVDDAITVEQALTILARHYAFAEAEVKSELTLDSFSDAAEIGEYAKEAVAWAVTNGIYEGKDGVLAPAAPADRAAVASMLYKAATVYAAK